jgi:hypothetical protein
MQTMTDERFLTPPQIAKLLGVGVDKVAAFIERGELIAVNTSLASKPRWKIEPESLRRFLTSRSNAPKTAPKTRKRSDIPKPTREYV